MYIGIECLGCLVRQTIDVLMIIGLSDDKKIQIVREMLAYIATLDLSSPPPVVSREVYSRLSEITGVEDPYCLIKKK